MRRNTVKRYSEAFKQQVVQEVESGQVLFKNSDVNMALAHHSVLDQKNW